MHKPTVTAVMIAVFAAMMIAYIGSTLSFAKQIQNNKSLRVNGFDVSFKTISSIIRTNLTAICTINNIVYAGDDAGAIAIWTFDQKKASLEFQDISRPVQPVLPPRNPVLHLEADEGGVLALTSDGKMKSYSVLDEKKFLNSILLPITGPSSSFTLFRPTAPTQKISPLLLGQISEDRKSVCIYLLQQSIRNPLPLTKLFCNTTTSSNSTYNYVTFDRTYNLMVTGDQNKVVAFKIDVVSSIQIAAKFLMYANLPKVDVKGAKGIFVDGGLVVVNDLWVSLFQVDIATPALKVISADRTEKTLKSGETTFLSAFFNPSTKKSLVMLNSKDKLQAYTLMNNKLTYFAQSKTIGNPTTFLVYNDTILLATVGTQLLTLKIGGITSLLTVENEGEILSGNHETPVKSVAADKTSGFIVTTSEGGKGNVRVWEFNGDALKFGDQKTITYGAALKTGAVSFQTSVLISPSSKSNANQSYHAVVAGSEPFSLYILPVTIPYYKFGSAYKSKGQHTNNISSVFVSSDKKKLVTASMDTTIKVWTLTANQDQVEDTVTTVSTKMGPIPVGIQSKSGEYYAFGHSNNGANKIVNISIWKEDPKLGLIKLAQNVLGEAHDSNLTGLVLSHDDKYLVSLSQTGEMRLWRVQNWTMVDLLASLSTTVLDATIKATESNTIIIESEKFFAEYSFDFFGFLLIGRVDKPFNSGVHSSLAVGKTWFSGGIDGSIRIFTYSD